MLKIINVKIVQIIAQSAHLVQTAPAVLIMLIQTPREFANVLEVIRDKKGSAVIGNAEDAMLMIPTPVRVVMILLIMMRI